MKILNEATWLKPAGIEKVEKFYEAKYLFESCVKTTTGNWSMQTALFFYTEEAHPQGSNYLGLHRFDGRLHVFDGLKYVTGIDIDGIRADNGDIIYSRHRHDYRWSPDNTVSIDGGRDYTHWSAPDMDPKRIVKLGVFVDKFVVLNEEKVINNENA